VHGTVACHAVMVGNAPVAMGPEDVGAEFFDLLTAETADDLRRILVSYPPQRRTADAFEPYLLLAKHHKNDPAGAAVTAMLMVTDVRWRDGAGRLIRQIEQSGMVEDGALDLLAEAFLAAGDALYWEVPDEWFGDEIVIAIDEADQEIVEGEEDDDERPTVARRQVFPPLRRWAAGRLVGGDPERWAGVFERSGDLDARAAAAVMSGLLDVVGGLPAATQEFLIDRAIRWPQHSVRRQGIGLVAERKGPEAAHAIAAADPNGSVRAWAASLLEPAPSPQDRPPAHPEAPQHKKPPAPAPPTLF
jgi:hypothetical protein